MATANAIQLKYINSLKDSKEAHKIILHEKLYYGQRNLRKCT